MVRLRPLLGAFLAAITVVAAAQGGVVEAKTEWEEVQATEPTSAGDGPAVAEAEDAPSLGSAIFSPFSAPSEVSSPSQVIPAIAPPSQEKGSPATLTMTLVVAAAGTAAVGWLFLRL